VAWSLRGVRDSFTALGETGSNPSGSTLAQTEPSTHDTTCQDIAAIRRIRFGFDQQHRKKLMQFAEFLSGQAVQLLHGEKRDHVILLFLFETRPIQVFSGSGRRRKRPAGTPSGAT